jgi:hypothetical protein
METVHAEIVRTNPMTVVSVGGYGPIDRELKSIMNELGGILVSLDIDEKHSPLIHGDVEDIQELLLQRRITPDLIIALEVMEHVPDFQKAISGCRAALPAHGKLILSTPWIIPIHDRPSDYYRFTPAALHIMLKEFSEVRIFARGNFYDSIVALMLRGLFSSRLVGKIFVAIGIFLSIFTRKPTVHSSLESIDSAIGYITIASVS